MDNAGPDNGNPTSPATPEPNSESRSRRRASRHSLHRSTSLGRPLSSSEAEAESPARERRRRNRSLSISRSSLGFNHENNDQTNTDNISETDYTRSKSRDRRRVRRSQHDVHNSNTTSLHTSQGIFSGSSVGQSMGSFEPGTISPQGDTGNEIVTPSSATPMIAPITEGQVEKKKKKKKVKENKENSGNVSGGERSEYQEDASPKKKVRKSKLPPRIETGRGESDSDGARKTKTKTKTKSPIKKKSTKKDKMEIESAKTDNGLIKIKSPTADEHIFLDPLDIVRVDIPDDIHVEYANALTSPTKPVLTSTERLNAQETATLADAESNRDLNVVFVEEGRRFRRVMTGNGIDELSEKIQLAKAVDAQEEEEKKKTWEVKMLDVVHSFENNWSYLVFIAHDLLGGICLLSLCTFPFTLPSTLSPTLRDFLSFYAPISNLHPRIFWFLCTCACLNGLNVFIKRMALTGESSSWIDFVNDEKDVLKGKLMGMTEKGKYIIMVRYTRKRKMVAAWMLFFTFIAYLMSLLIIQIDDRIWFTQSSPKGGAYGNSTQWLSQATFGTVPIPGLITDMRKWNIYHIIRGICGLLSWFLVMYERKLHRDWLGRKASLVHVVERNGASRGYEGSQRVSTLDLV